MHTLVPLKIIHVDQMGYHLFAKAKVNGKIANLLVDTGASKTVFDSNRIEKFAASNQMVVNDHLSTGLGTSSMQSHTICLNKFQLGELIIQKLEVFLLDLSHVNLTYQKLKYKPLDGVIGGDILMQYNAIINYQSKAIKLSWKRNKE
jgi:Aspartyl protease